MDIYSLEKADERIVDLEAEITRLRTALANEREECAKVAEAIGASDRRSETATQQAGYPSLSAAYSKQAATALAIATAIRNRKDKGE